VPQLLKIFTRALGKGLKSEFDLVKVEANPAK